jgi:hypothetical protein
MCQVILSNMSMRCLLCDHLNGMMRLGDLCNNRVICFNTFKNQIQYYVIYSNIFGIGFCIVLRQVLFLTHMDMDR